jgi:hypothetical protein
MEQWRTAEDIAAEHDRLAATLNDWHPPYAHGVGLIPGDAATPSADHFHVVNVGRSSLPGVVMADVTGYRRGNASFTLRRVELERAIRQLAPAEAFTEHPHPNLWAWRDRYLPALTTDPHPRLVAVFLATEEASSGETAEVAAFRKAVEAHLGYCRQRPTA